jgi:hypothetical protein
MNIKSNLSGSTLEHDLQPLQIEINFFLDFQHMQSSKLFNTLVTCPEGSLNPIFHQDSSHCLQQETERHQRHSRHRCRHHRQKRQAGNVGGSRVEPFLGRLFPWRTCHAGAWIKHS